MLLLFFGGKGGALFWKTLAKKGWGSWPIQIILMFTAPFRADNLIFVDQKIQSDNNKIFPRALSESEFG